MRYEMKPQGVCSNKISFDLNGDVVTNVVFTNGAVVRDNGQVLIYYASSDTRIHVAETTQKQLEDYVFHTPKDPGRSADCVRQRVEMIRRNKEFLKRI